MFFLLFFFAIENVPEAQTKLIFIYSIFRQPSAKFFTHQNPEDWVFFFLKLIIPKFYLGALGRNIVAKARNYKSSFITRVANCIMRLHDRFTVPLRVNCYKRTLNQNFEIQMLDEGGRKVRETKTNAGYASFMKRKRDNSYIP